MNHTRPIITEERIAPVIDAEQAQNAVPHDPNPVKIIYDRDINSESGGSTIGISAFTGGYSERFPVLISFRFVHGGTTRHLSVEDAKALRQALTEAIAAREAVTGAL